MIIPREQATQRARTADVSAPGVRLWSCHTVYVENYDADIELTDVVEPGDVELAHRDRPSDFFYDVETSADLHADYPGIYENREFGEGAFGEGPFGGVETEWATQYGPPAWNVGKADG